MDKDAVHSQPPPLPKKQVDPQLLPIPVQRVGKLRLVIVELFGGIMPVSTAARELGMDVEACYFSEVDPDAILVATTIHPEARGLGDINVITAAVVADVLHAHPDAYFEYDCSHKQCAYESWQACQRMNDERNKLQEKPE